VVVRRTLSARDAADAIGAVLADAVQLFDGGAGSTAAQGSAGQEQQVTASLSIAAWECDGGEGATRKEQQERAAAARTGLGRVLAGNAGTAGQSERRCGSGQDWQSQRSDTGGGEGEYELPVQSLAQVLDRLRELRQFQAWRCIGRASLVWGWRHSSYLMGQPPNHGPWR
jgi:hypothetical protein